ncbi:hypothetical protein ACEWY4_019640 [Coilia grayii]|uniref:Uncharacterized protein n=1 Tax=Coilia grayii TaxID=363190 RepID=A0ABD1JAE9_9TELE
MTVYIYCPHEHTLLCFYDLGPPLDPDLGNRELHRLVFQRVEKPTIPDYSNFRILVENIDLGDSQTSLQWVTFRDPSHLQMAYKTEVDGEEHYVCRPTNLCLLGFFDPLEGYVCIYSLAKQVRTAKDFQVLVNKGNFELLEWIANSYGKVPKYSINSCTSNFVGKNRYGLGNVDTVAKAFYLPWISDKTEYWYSYYEVLTVVHEPYDQHLSEVSYFSEKVNITKHPPHTLKRSRVTNNHDKEVTQSVSLKETTETTSAWETGISTTLSLSTTISTGIPNIGKASVSVGLQTSFSLSTRNSKSQREDHSLSLEVKVPPGCYCEVRMEGTKTEAAIPFSAHITKTYKNGKTHHASITGVYRGVQVGEINAVVDRCVPIITSMVHTDKGAASPSTQASRSVILVTWFFGVTTLAAVLTA